jgi:hypothetical protein
VLGVSDAQLEAEWLLWLASPAADDAVAWTPYLAVTATPRASNTPLPTFTASPTGPTATFTASATLTPFPITVQPSITPVPSNTPLPPGSLQRPTAVPTPAARPANFCGGGLIVPLALMLGAFAARPKRQKKC